MFHGISLFLRVWLRISMCPWSTSLSSFPVPVADPKHLSMQVDQRPGKEDQNLICIILLIILHPFSSQPQNSPCPVVGQWANPPDIHHRIEFQVECSPVGPMTPCLLVKIPHIFPETLYIVFAWIGSDIRTLDDLYARCSPFVNSLYPPAEMGPLQLAISP